MIAKRLSGVDAKDIALIENLCFSCPWSEAMIAEELCNPVSEYYGMRQEGRLVAYAGIQIVADEGYMTNIAVHPDYRRLGMAKRLMDRLFERAVERGLTMISLEVRESNYKAVNLYKAYGFTRVGRRKNYYQNPAEDALILTRYFQNEGEL